MKRKAVATLAQVVIPSHGLKDSVKLKRSSLSSMPTQVQTSWDIIASAAAETRSTLWKAKEGNLSASDTQDGSARHEQVGHDNALS